MRCPINCSVRLESCPAIIGPLSETFPIIPYRTFPLIFLLTFPLENSWRTESSRHECDEHVTAVSSPEGIPCDGRGIATALRAATPFGIPPSTPHSLEAGLEEVATQVPRVQGEHMFDGLTDIPVLEEWCASKIRPIPSASSARLENAMRE